MMHTTKNDLKEVNRLRLTAYLNARLADCLDLGSQTKQAHWNVKGPSFRALHELFDDIAEDIEDYSDMLAERVVQLGGTAMGTARLTAANSVLKEYPHTITSGQEHVEALSNALAAFGESIRASIAHCEELEDANSADICTEISRGIDKWLWMVEAHQQAKD